MGRRMKRVAFALIALVIGGVVLAYVRPERLVSLLEQVPSGGRAAISIPLYQWKDERGEWQVTDRPPPGGTSFEVKQYGSDTNILPVSKLKPGKE
jgi:hypothetical protein